MSAQPSLRPAVSEAELLAVMPDTARTLVKALGFVEAVELMRKHGGKRLNMPATLKDRSVIVQQLGPALAKRLASWLPTGCVEVPTVTAIERHLRDIAIRRDFDAGLRYHQLVERYDLTHRHLRKILDNPSRLPQREQVQR